MSVREYAIKHKLHENTVKNRIKDNKLVTEKDSTGKVFIIEETKDKAGEELTRSAWREKLRGMTRQDMKDLLAEEMMLDYLMEPDLRLRAATIDKIIKLKGFEKDALWEKNTSLLKELHDTMEKKFKLRCKTCEYKQGKKKKKGGK